MSVSHSQEADSTETFSLKAKGYLKVLWMERDDETHNTVTFKGGKLWSSTYTQWESGKKTNWNTVHFDGSKYTVVSNQGNYFLHEIPYFSVLKLYFQQPKNISRIFSEAEGGFIPLKKVNEDTYEVKNSKGDRSVYFYKNGKIDRLEFHTSIAKVNMKKIA